MAPATGAPLAAATMPAAAATAAPARAGSARRSITAVPSAAERRDQGYASSRAGRPRAMAAESAPAGGHVVDDVVHDARQLEVLRRVDRGDTGVEEPWSIGFGDDPADDHRGIDPLGPDEPDHLGDQLQMAAREDRQTDDVDVLVAGDGGDLLGGEPDALVDDLHAGVAGRHRD